MKRPLFIFLITALLFLAPWYAYTAEQDPFHPIVVLNKIEMVQPGEKSGDELYLAITTFPFKGDPSYHLIPERPLYWPSDKVSQIKDLKVFETHLNANEAVTLVLELIDQDVPPWNTDDLIGEIKLHIKNNNGKLQAMWVMPNNDQFMPIPGAFDKPVTFDIQNKQGHYKLTYTIKRE